MRVLSLNLRSFRSYERAVVEPSGGITVVWGPNGAGKTNLLEALYFGCTGRSCRTTNDREVVRFGSTMARVVVEAGDDEVVHRLSVAFTPGQPKHITVDGAPVERLLDNGVRPRVSVFLPDRLELIKGGPGLRRAHLDQVVAALWPARSGSRRAYAQTLAQRNALLLRVRAGTASRASLAPWDSQLAGHAIALTRDRAEALDTLAPSFRDLASTIGLDGDPKVAYRPRTHAAEPEQLVEELQERLQGDLERGFTSHGPHRDEIAILREGRELRAFGSQGQQRLALLALLLAEREALARRSASLPLLLLDDVMSELDGERREALATLLTAGGQSVVTATDREHVPDILGDATTIVVRDGAVVEESVA